MSIHMPRAASRITIPVDSVRVERVQDITADDIVAEAAWNPAHSVDEDCSQAYEAWADLWDSINLKRGYGMAANPLVWVLSLAGPQEEGGAS